MHSITGIAVRTNCGQGSPRGPVDASAFVSGARRWWTAGLIAGVLMANGCSVCYQARRTMCDELSAYSASGDRRRSVKTYRALADRAWCDERQACPTLPASEPYALGFSDGFTSFAFAGGSGEPPPVPPRQFWNVSCRTAEGKAAADDWFAGYRHGARVARAGGFRDAAVVHSSLAWSGEDGIPPQGELLLNPPEDIGPPPPPSPEGEVIGPALKDSSTVEPPHDSGADEAPAAATPNDVDSPSATPSGDTLPAPPANDSKQTTQSSANEFMSVLRSAADRHGNKSAPAPTIEAAVQPVSGESPSLRPAPTPKQEIQSSSLRL